MPAPRKKKPGSGRLPGGSNADPLAFVLGVTPRPKERPRFSRQGHSYTPAATRAFEAEVARLATKAMAEAGREPFEVPVRVRATFCLAGDPALWPTAQRDGDLDNHEKALLDALNRVAWTDDRLVVEKSSRKMCGAEPHILVAIEPAGPSA